MPYVELEDQNRLWYEEKGSGTPVVFIHGWLHSSWNFSNQVDYFSKAYRVFAFDHKGHGKSDKPEDVSYTMPELAEDLSQALDKLIGDNKFVLIGHSMGGSISLIYATNPDFKKKLLGLILMSTAPESNYLKKNPRVQASVNMVKNGKATIVNPENLKNFTVPFWFNKNYIQTHEDTIKKIVEEALKIPEYVAFKSLIAWFDLYDVENKLGEIEVPTLILSGDKDMSIPLEYSELMHRKIKNSKLKIFSPNIGHMIHFEAQKECNKAIEDFLKEL